MDILKKQLKDLSLRAADAAPSTTYLLAQESSVGSDAQKIQLKALYDVVDAKVASLSSAVSLTYAPKINTANGVNNYAPINNPIFTGTVAGITQSMVGLGNVENESKSTMFNNPTFTGTVSGVTSTMVGLGNVSNESKTSILTNPIITGLATINNVDITGDIQVDERPFSVMFGGSTFISANNSVMTFGSDTHDVLIGGAKLTVGGPVLPHESEIYDLGSANYRWNQMYYTTGSIGTSDARLKTEVSELTQNELSASKQLASEIGTYKFLSAIAQKGDSARKHIGMTVQRAIEIMTENNLNPFDYGFICYDEWDAEYKSASPAVLSRDEWTEEIMRIDDNGNEYVSKTIHHDAIEASDEVLPNTIIEREAGNIYSFRYTELLAFIVRGFEQRLSILENK